MKQLRKIAALVALILSASLSTRAQVLENAYFTIDWQVGIPVGTSFADKASGWGMNFEGGYHILPQLAVGGFLNYQTNLRSVGRETLALSPNTALTTKQKHAVFQIPFGVTSRWLFLTKGIAQPYVGLKLGPNYSQFSSYYYVVQRSVDRWGFYLSPEVGVNLYPNPHRRYGFHVAAYYSYATNRGDLMVYHIDGLNNFGFRFGVVF